VKKRKEAINLYRRWKRTVVADSRGENSRGGGGRGGGNPLPGWKKREKGVRGLGKFGRE